MADNPALSEDIRVSLTGQKYAIWASDLDKGTLSALLWFVGEFGYRARGFEGGAGADKFEELQENEASTARMRAALQGIAHIVAGKRMTLEDAKEWIRYAVAFFGHPSGSSLRGPSFPGQGRV